MFELSCQQREIGMADRELIAAILTAGMLPTLEIPQSRTRSRHGPLARAEADTIQHAVDHAFGVYRLVLSRQSRNQTSDSGRSSTSAVRAILDDPPIHIRPDLPAARVQSKQTLWV